MHSKNKLNKTTKEFVKFVSSKKAQDIVGFNISKISSIADYMVICSGLNQRHVKMLAKEWVEISKKNKLPLLGAEGIDTGWWAILDAGDSIFHVFHPDAREFYGMEILWGDAPEMNMGKILKSEGPNG